MLLDAHVYTAPSEIRGFDANHTLTPGLAGAFQQYGYEFCVRYVRRNERHDFDLTGDEVAGILDAGLGLMIVQHVESAHAWRPTATKGRNNGRVAAQEAMAIGIPAGVTVWCDLEGVDPTVPAHRVIDYCNSWHSNVAAAGFVPGLYVGWHSGLTATQLYSALRSTHYWGAYNLAIDEEPSARGLQMKQSECEANERVPGVEFTFQVDVIRTDRLGGRPALLAPAGWAAGRAQ